MEPKAPVFEKIYQDYLARVAGLNLTEKQAARYLDMECLAMIAMVLAERLAGKTNPYMAMLA